MRAISPCSTRPTPTRPATASTYPKSLRPAVEPEPSCVTAPILRLDLRDAGITTIIWATGFAFDFGWLKVGALDTRGVPAHWRGITEVPGLYVLGLPFLSRRASSFIFGVEQDAARLADHIAARQ